MEKIQTFFKDFNWTAPAWDLLIIVLIAVAVFMYGFSLGRERVVAIVLSIYAGYAVASNLPRSVMSWFLELDVGEAYMIRIGLFLIAMVVFIYLLLRSGIFEDSRGGTSLGVLAIFSVLHVGLLVSVIFSFLPAASLADFSFVAQKAFGSDIGRTIWIIAPIVGLVFSKSGGTRLF